MQTNDSSIYIFNTHALASAAVQSLAGAGFDVKKLSLVGRGYHTEEHPLGFYTTGDRIRTWGGTGAGLGLIAMAGPVVAALVGALEGAVVVGGLSALGAALTGIGVSGEQAIKYETALKVDKYLLMVHGSAADQELVRKVLAAAPALLPS